MILGSLGAPVDSGTSGLRPLPLPSQGRNPRAILKINDKVIRKIDSLEYIENNYNQPDSFRCVLPLYNQQDAIDIEYWLSNAAILVEIFTGFPQDPVNYGIGDLQSLVLGGINDLTVQVFENGGGFVQFNGFDLSKKFVDTKTTVKYQNQTSSQIATTLAQAQNLNPVVTATTTPAGYYYNQDYITLGNEVTQWDLLVFLAQQEGFQVFVRGQNLYFQPQQTQTSQPYLFQAQTPEVGPPSFNGTRLSISRNLNFARDVIVTVKSWNAKAGNVSVTATATKTKKNTLNPAAGQVGYPQTYIYFIPGLSKDQALDRANKLLEDISQHERILSLSCPADNLLHKDSLIQLQGVSESADQIYYPDTITRRMSPSEGYSMDVIAKNHSPQSVVSL